MATAYLVLDDGRIFEGSSWACTGKSFGEAVFQTGMTGYQETLTDPSYHKQIVVMTAPNLGPRASIIIADFFERFLSCAFKAFVS